MRSTVPTASRLGPRVHGWSRHTPLRSATLPSARFLTPDIPSLAIAITLFDTTRAT